MPLKIISGSIRNAIQKSIIGKLSKTTADGSNVISSRLRGYLEKIRTIWLASIPLAGMTFAAAVGVPQINVLIAKNQADAIIYSTVEFIPSGSRFQWPLNRFGISQNYAPYHPGLDMTAPAGTPVKPIMEGKVVLVDYLNEGYGKHIVIQHINGTRSLYAHLSQIDVTLDQEVKNTTYIGTVGSTGLSTGDHLHLEIHENGSALNPFEVLPELKRENLLPPFTPLSSPPASPSPSPLP